MDYNTEQRYSEIREYFDAWYNRGKFTLNQLERIKNIIEESKGE